MHPAANSPSKAFKIGEQEPTLVLGSERVSGPEQDQQRTQRGFPRQQGAKVSVFGDQHAFLTYRPMEDGVVGGALKAPVSHMDGVVATRNKPLGDLVGQVRVEQEPHGLCEQWEFTLLDRCGGELERSEDVILD